MVTDAASCCLAASNTFSPGGNSWHADPSMRGPARLHPDTHTHTELQLLERTHSNYILCRAECPSRLFNLSVPSALGKLCSSLSCPETQEEFQTSRLFRTEILQHSLVVILPFPKPLLNLSHCHQSIVPGRQRVWLSSGHIIWACKLWKQHRETSPWILPENTLKQEQVHRNSILAMVGLFHLAQWGSIDRDDMQLCSSVPWCPF